MAMSLTVTPARPTVKPTTLAKLNRCDHLWLGDVLVIASATELGKLYKVTTTGCTCKGASEFNIKCWHVEARRHLLASIDAPATVLGPRNPDEIDDADDRLTPAWQVIDTKRSEKVRAAMAGKQYTEADYDDCI